MTKHSRLAFTLIEMMMVLGIMAVIAGISFGVVLNSTNQTGVMAAENLIANMVRQARNTALSTGAPVELRIEPDANKDWKVTGISQRVVLSDTFEFKVDGNGNFWERRSLEDMDDKPVAGLSGLGWQPSAIGTGASSAGIRTIAMPGKSTAFMRRTSDGFYLSAWVKPPPLRNPSVAGIDVGLQLAPSPSSGSLWDNADQEGDEYDGKPLRYIPLVSITDAKSSPANPSQVFAGIQLELWSVHIQNGPDGIQAKAFYWVPVAVLNGKRVCIGAPGNSRNKTIHNRIESQTWTQIGMLCNGSEVQLFVDEHPMVSSSLTSSDIDSDYTNFVNTARHTGSFAHIMHAAGQSAPGFIDNVRILSLGRDQPIRMPKGAQLNAPHRIVADGTNVTVFRQDNSSKEWDELNNDAALVVTMKNETRINSAGDVEVVGNRKINKAEIRINGVGRVSSKLSFSTGAGASAVTNDDD